ncbi:MAG: hypothetical protein SFZ02_04745 [bacterium]|nr:hypothetical protein [bacterium]
MPPIWLNRARWNSIFCGAVIFFWSALEDNDLTIVTLLALWLTISLVALWGINQFKNTHPPRSHIPLLVIIIGAGMGILTSINMAGLMLFKNLRHSHFFPDYPFEMMRDILARAPFWAVAGMFITSGIYLLYRIFTQKRDV